MSSVPRPAAERVVPSDLPFFVALIVLGGSYLVLIVAMLVADLFYTTPGHLLDALNSPEIRYAIKLSLISCSITTILSLWTAVPLGYLMSRFQFPGKWLADSILDIPIVLPPLIIGLSLLILFQTDVGRWLESFTQKRMGMMVVSGLAPVVLCLGLMALLKLILAAAGMDGGRVAAWIWVSTPLAFALLYVTVLLATGLNPASVRFAQQHFATRITYAIPSVILAQFAVSAAFAVRTMRVTFDQINPRTEQVALTLGCTRAQAFWMVALPQARRGLLTAATLAWARALGEFGPILIFAGATRMKTEVLSTTVFLELSIGNLEAAVAVSILMVLTALLVLVIVRVFGVRGTDVF